MKVVTITGQGVVILLESFEEYDALVATAAALEKKSSVCQQIAQSRISTTEHSVYQFGCSLSDTLRRHRVDEGFGDPDEHDWKDVFSYLLSQSSVLKDTEE